MERRIQREGVVIGECAPNLNVGLARQCIPNRQIVEFKIGPELLGWPTSRFRSFCVYLNSETTPGSQYWFVVTSVVAYWVVRVCFLRANWSHAELVTGKLESAVNGLISFASS